MVKEGSDLWCEPMMSRLIRAPTESSDPRDAQRDVSLSEAASQARSMLSLCSGEDSERALRE
jgi:hypothetical protein